MNREKTVYLTVHYINGESYEFEWTPQPGQQGSLTQFLQGNEIILELEDRVVVIPMENVQAMEISPPPENLPDTTIRNVRQVD
ncbi:MAG: hypothetical protein ACP5D7_06800 [Limnospira sp.]